MKSTTKGSEKQSFIFRLLDTLSKFIYEIRENHLRRLNEKVDVEAGKRWREDW